MQLSKRLQAIEERTKRKTYIPVLMVNGDDDIEKMKHLIGPKTVIIIDDIEDDE